MKYYISEYNQGTNVLPAELQHEIEDVISTITTKPAKGASESLRKEALARLRSLGWSGEVQVAQGSNITITSTKRRVGLCLQVGNVARIYADMMKLQALYLNNTIMAAGIVVPSKSVALKLGGNLAQGDRLIRELEIFRKVYTVPTMIFELEDL
ncbi:hypothetical protein FIM12_03815 [SAR202 cluster bacterium AD-804-J14_MRT_500m]|nr:hypothetical protein [SAR202 cluster bacterium AD-804-J14_MRT_500m]